jgi:hypothetical protein
MSMFTRCDGDVTIIAPVPEGGYVYAVAAPLATYTGTVDTLHEALLFALTGYYLDELGPDDTVSLDPRG